MGFKEIITLLIGLITLTSVSAHTGHCGQNFNASASHTCTEIFDRFRYCESTFIRQALMSSNPFTMCNATYESYTNMTLFFDLLNNSTDKEHSNEICSDEYLNKNQMSVITTIVSTSKNLWDSAHCDDCYNGTTSAHKFFSNHTLEINELQSKYSDCVASQLNVSSICHNCMKQYLDLNQKSETEKKRREGKICFDIEDIMNKTRQEWSGSFKCCKDKHDSLTAFYSLFSSVISVTVLFYLTIYFTGSRFKAGEIIDASQVLTAPLIPQPSPSLTPTTSSSTTPTNRRKQKSPTLVINEDSEVDEFTKI